MKHDALHQLLRTRPTLDRLLDSILTAGSDDGRTTVDDILADGDVPRRQAINLLRDLESLGYGAFKVGRKGHPSRFEWSIDPADLVASLDGGGDEDPIGDHADGQQGSLERETSSAEGNEHGQARVLFMQGNQASLDLGESAMARSVKRRSDEQIAHLYVLRPDYRVSLSLPDNLTQREAEVLADWVRNLSFER